MSSSQKFNVGDVGVVSKMYDTPYPFFIVPPKDFWEKYASEEQMRLFHTLSRRGDTVIFFRIGAENFEFASDAAVHCQHLVSLFDEKAFRCFNEHVTPFLSCGSHYNNIKVMGTLRLVHQRLLGQNELNFYPHCVETIGLVNALQEYKPTIVTQ